MKAVILAGGLGTRLAEETDVIPKPLVQIGGLPILWHIMKILSHNEINDFIICCGYKGYEIKKFFSDYYMRNSDVTFDLGANTTTFLNQRTENWKVTLVDTGDDALTGARLKAIQSIVSKEDSFLMTYGDGVADVDIKKLTEFHNNHGKLATVTAVVPPGRFGRIERDSSANVIGFDEKPAGEVGLINGGFFVLNPDCFDYIYDQNEPWETGGLARICEAGELKAYAHNGFWKPMDTLRDKIVLNDLWETGEAPWKVWA